MTRFQNRLILPPTRILTHVRVLCSVLLVSLFVLNAYAQDTTSTVVRTNANGDITASGTDVAEVQKATGAANGDVITLYGNATNNSTVDLTSTFNTVTIRSSKPGVKRTINCSVEGLALTESGTYTFNLSDLDYQGLGPIINDGASWEPKQCDIRIYTDNVSFTGIKRHYHNGTVFSANHSSMQIIAKNGLVFDSISTYTAEMYAGAIYCGGNLTITADSLTIKDNDFSRQGDGGASGGAITVHGATTTISGTSSESVFLFSGNLNEYTAGAIYCNDIYFSTGKYIFQNNGGWAIYTEGSVTFSGDDTTAEFKGQLWFNDICCGNLCFTDCGTYSFEGGIESGQTSINQATVTIAGRQYKPIIDDPLVVDATYHLSQTTISNGGTLTANMDYINSFSGTITFDGTDSLFTLNKGSNSATIKSSEGNGVTGLNFNTASDVEAVSISSGRIDIKGTMSASLELQNDAVFSPGNSVGTLNLDGNVIANAVTLFEFAAYNEEPASQLYDKLVINGDHSFIVGADSVIQLFFENGDSLAWAKEGAEYKLVSDEGFMSEVTDLSSLLGNYSDRFALEGRSDGLYLIGLGEPTVPVPEPSTWALLVLGVMGMFYVRKVRS